MNFNGGNPICRNCNHSSMGSFSLRRPSRGGTVVTFANCMCWGGLGGVITFFRLRFQDVATLQSTSKTLVRRCNIFFK